jgi:Flp pilus assembly protein TadB
MIEVQLLETGLFLGALVFLGGCYGILYSVGHLLDRPGIRLAGFACYGLQCIITLAVVGLSPLTGSWKLVVVVGTLGTLGIPPVTWRFVQWTHATGEHA